MKGKDYFLKDKNGIPTFKITALGNYALETDDLKRLGKILKVPDDMLLSETGTVQDPELNVVYVSHVSHGHSVVVTFKRDMDKDEIIDMEARVSEEMDRILGTDDFWVDHVWMDYVKLPIDDNVLEKIVTGNSGRIDPDNVVTIFEDGNEYLVKMNCLLESGYSFPEAEKYLDDCYVGHYPKGEWIEGNWGVEFPYNWLADKAEEIGSDDLIMKNFLYFAEGFAKLFSDDVPNSNVEYARCGDYFFESH